MKMESRSSSGTGQEEQAGITNCPGTSSSLLTLPYTDFGARQYSPTLSRWLVPDPMSEKYYDVSPYAYCVNNPVNLVDPNGGIVTDYFDQTGNYLTSDNIDNGIIKITNEEIVQMASLLSDSQKFSYLNDNSVTLNKAFSYGIIDEDAALRIFEHYNKTGLPLVVDDTLSGNFATNNAEDVKSFRISVNIQKCLTTDKQGFTLDNYFDIHNALNIHEGQGHYQRIREMGPQKYSEIPVSERERKAIEIQMRDSSWKKTTQKFKLGVLKYYMQNKK